MKVFCFSLEKNLFMINSWASSKGGHSELQWYLLPDGQLVLGIASQIIQQTIDTLAQTLASRQLHLTKHVSQAVSSFCWKILRIIIIKLSFMIFIDLTSIHSQLWCKLLLSRIFDEIYWKEKNSVKFSSFLQSKTCH